MSILGTRRIDSGKKNANIYSGFVSTFIFLFISVMLTNQFGITAYAMETTVPDFKSNFYDTSGYHANLPILANSVPFSSNAHTSQATMPATESDGNGQMISLEKDFTTQASLALAKATQTNNVINTRSYYDVMFRTTTAGAIKTVDIDFPQGTYVGAALLVEASGIGPGTISANPGELIRYTVSSPVNVPANTNIRIQIANINNPSTPSNSLTVMITTRDASNIIIDGPTASQAYSIKPIGSKELDPTLIVSRLLLDNAQGASFGWNPNGINTDFILFDDTIIEPNAVLINVGDSDSNSQCESLGSLDGFFTIRCNLAPPNGSELRYTILNIPPS